VGSTPGCARQPLVPELGGFEAAVIEALRPFWESRDKVLSLVFGWVRDQANASSKIFLPKLSKEWH
jgi:hypothetical protein